MNYNEKKKASIGNAGNKQLITAGHSYIVVGVVIRKMRWKKKDCTVVSKYKNITGIHG